MGLLDGKKGLIMGLANDHSIAWGIAQALHAEGADLAFTYVGDALERRVRPLAESLGSKLIAPCDVQRDDQIDALMGQVRDVYGSLDILIHGIAFANMTSRAARIQHHPRRLPPGARVSAYSPPRIKPRAGCRTRRFTLTYRLAAGGAEPQRQV